MYFLLEHEPKNVRDHTGNQEPSRRGEVIEMAGRIKRIARGIDSITKAVWDESGVFVKIVILVILLVTAAAIPVIPIAIIARYIVNR